MATAAKSKVVGCLNAVAVGGLAVDAAGVVGVEEVILVIVLVRLPLREGVADREDDAAEHETEGIVVDAQSLRMRRAAAARERS